MMRALLAAAICCAVAAAESPAHAQSYYFREDVTKATYVYSWTTTLAPCSSSVFRTENLSVGADTVMYLVNSAGEEIAYNDDYGTSLKSRIQMNVSCSSPAATVTVWVMAQTNAEGGNGGGTCGDGYSIPDSPGSFCFNMYFNISNLGRHRLGGYILPQINTVASDSVETVLVNNGAGATRLFRFRHDGTHYRFYGYNTTGGVGIQSRYSGTAYGNERWVVATPSESTREGPVRVVRNDASSGDSDGDGLGNYLESEACTCSLSGTYLCAAGGTYSCSTGIVTKKDSDNDGLLDPWELVGYSYIDFVGQDYPIYFPLMGASPRHKDVFVEIDKHPDSPPFTETDAMNAARPYANLPISNLDGVQGISVHFDAGIDCTQEPNNRDLITPTCGNFGGSNSFEIAQGDTVCDQNYLNTGYLHSQRQAKFHWMWRAPALSGNGTRPGVCSWISDIVWDATANQPNDYGGEVVAHELGHNLGLQHIGESTAGDQNRKPNYRSLMNYSYQPGLWDSDATTLAFSTGTLGTLDPKSLSETVDYGGSVDLQFLTRNDSAYMFPFDPANQRDIDWNRDGYHDPSVRAHVLGQPFARTNGNELPITVGASDIPIGAIEMKTYAAPGAAYLAPYTMLVGNWDNSNTFWFSYRTSSAWSWWAQLNGAISMRVDSSPAVVAFDGSLFVFGVKTTNTIAYARFSPTGALQGSWNTLAFPPGTTLREVNAVVHDGALYVFAVDETIAPEPNPLGQIWWTSSSTGTSWNAWTLATLGNGTPIASRGADIAVTPGPVVGPDGELYVFVRGAPATPRAGDIDLYWFGTGFWTRWNGNWVGNPDSCTTVGKIGATYQPFLTASGSPLARGTGALWTWYMCDPDRTEPIRTKYRWSWGTLSSTEQSFGMGPWHESQLGSYFSSATCGDLDGQMISPTTFDPEAQENGAGVALVSHAEGVQAFLGHTSVTADRDQACDDAILHLPSADGTGRPTTLPADVNDVPIMSAHLCSSLYTYSGNCTGICTPPDITCAPPVVQHVVCDGSLP